VWDGLREQSVDCAPPRTPPRRRPRGARAQAEAQVAEALAAAERAEKTARSEGGNGSKASRARESHGRAETLRSSRAGPEPAPAPEPTGAASGGGKSGAVQGLEARLSQLQLPPSPGGEGEGGRGDKGPGDAVGGAPAAEGVEGRRGAPRGGWQEGRIAELEALVQLQARGGAGVGAGVAGWGSGAEFAGGAEAAAQLAALQQRLRESERARQLAELTLQVFPLPLQLPNPPSPGVPRPCVDGRGWVLVNFGWVLVSFSDHVTLAAR
jgi:hypothetical protein